MLVMTAAVIIIIGSMVTHVGLTIYLTTPPFFTCLATASAATVVLLLSQLLSQRLLVRARYEGSVYNVAVNPEAGTVAATISAVFPGSFGPRVWGFRLAYTPKCREV